MIAEIPKFMENPLWYTGNPDPNSPRGLILTDQAPEEVKQSYEDWYKMLEDVYC